MNFRQKSNDFERRGGQKKFVLAGFFVVIFILIFSFQAPREILFGIGGPFWGVKNSITSFFAGNIDLVRSKSSLIAENNLLKEEIQNNKEDQLLAEALKNENFELKDILNRKNNNQKGILGVILAKPFFSPYDTLLIDIGSADDISVGDQVLASGNIYIGSIVETYEHSSKIILYSSSGEKTKVLIGKNNLEKEAIGMGGGYFSIEAPTGSDIKIGDPVVIPSISQNIFSTVEKIDLKPTDSFETILFKNPINISELKWVLVVPAVNKSKN